MFSKKILALIFIIISINCFAQDFSNSSGIKKIELNKPSIVSTHPYGIFFSRWQGNFQYKTLDQYNFNITLESGNVWSPPVTSYIPNNKEDRIYISQFPWHSREFEIDVNTLDVKTLEVQNDGVIKGLRIHFNLPINIKSELKIGIRSFVLTNGEFPLSIITNDETIEYFHENVAGGEDPFDRQLYPLNEALIYYKDKNNRSMTIENGDFILSGFEFSYYRYPTNFIKGFNFNYGTHLGINTSKYNNSIDLGLSINTIKNFNLKNHKVIATALSLGGTKNNIINLKKDNINFSSNTFIGYLETLLEYSFLSKNMKTRHSIGADFYLQTSLNKKSEFDYLIPTKNGISTKSWNSGISNLYKNNNYWTLIYSFTRKMTTIFYIQQDFTVSNNPDIQAGINLSFNL